MAIHACPTRPQTLGTHVVGTPWLPPLLTSRAQTVIPHSTTNLLKPVPPAPTRSNVPLLQMLLASHHIMGHRVLVNPMCPQEACPWLGALGSVALSARGSRREEVRHTGAVPSPPMKELCLQWQRTPLVTPAPVAMPRVVVSGKDPFSERPRPPPLPAR